MAQYLVTVTGETREVYAVEAENEQAARENWMDGDLVKSEAGVMTALHVRLGDA